MVVLLFVVCAVCGALSQAEAASSRPNVLFLVVDDLRPELKCYGKTHMVTPNIDQMASRSIRFEQAYVQQAVCSPSRTSFLTGRRPDSTRIFDLKNYFRKLAGNYTTLPEHFKNNSYVTQSVGKIFHPDIQNSDYTIEFLKNRSMDNEPFFVGMGYHRPHLPFAYPQEYLSLYPLSEINLAPNPYYPPWLPQVTWSPFDELRSYEDISAMNISYPLGLVPSEYQFMLRRSYYAATSFTDAQVGRVLDALDQYGLANNTIITFHGDHGWQLGDHGEWCKRTNFDIATRIPKQNGTRQEKLSPLKMLWTKVSNFSLMLVLES